jgi:hypothetical protein
VEEIQDLLRYLVPADQQDAPRKASVEERTAQKIEIYNRLKAEELARPK